MQNFVSSQVKDIFKNESLDLQRGDIVRFYEGAYTGDDDFYRNDGIMIFNGTSLEHLSTEIHDGGGISREFPIVTEFPINYWRDIIDGYFVYFNHKPFLDQILKNLKCPGEKGHDEIDFEEQNNFFVWSKFNLYHPDIKKQVDEHLDLTLCSDLRNIIHKYLDDEYLLIIIADHDRNTIESKLKNGTPIDLGFTNDQFVSREIPESVLSKFKDKIVCVEM